MYSASISSASTLLRTVKQIPHGAQNVRRALVLRGQGKGGSFELPKHLFSQSPIAHQQAQNLLF